jgi:hypothetical protein
MQDQSMTMAKLTNRARNNYKRDGATLKSKQFKTGMREAAKMCEDLVGKWHTGSKITEDWIDDVLLHTARAIRTEAKK